MKVFGTLAHGLKLRIKTVYLALNMLSLRPATPNDFAGIELLAKDIWMKHYVPIIGLGQVNYMLNKLYSAEALQQQTKEGQVFHMVENKGKEIGFLSVSNPSTGHYFLHKFYLLQDLQNNGLGTQVFNKAFGELYQPQSIRLTVNRQNYKIGRAHV